MAVTTHLGNDELIFVCIQISEKDGCDLVRRPKNWYHPRYPVLSQERKGFFIVHNVAKDGVRTRPCHKMMVILATLNCERQALDPLYAKMIHKNLLDKSLSDRLVVLVPVDVQ